MGTSLPVLYVLALLVSTCRAGSVLLGGDDLTDHGGYNPATGEVTQGWKYISLAVQQLYVDSTLPNHEEVVVLLGSRRPDPASFSNGTLPFQNDAGEAYVRAMEDANLNLEFYKGQENISAYLQGVQAGTYRPTVIALAGSDAANDFTTEDNVALNQFAHVITEYVDRGGSMISHAPGTPRSENDVDVYEWLAAETGISHVSICNSTGAQLTDYGEVLFPNLTNSDIDADAGPCHAHFLPGDDNYAGFQPLALDGNGRVYLMIARGAVLGHPTIRMDCSHSTTTVAGDWTVDLPTADGVVFTVTFFVEAGVDGNEFESRLANALTSDERFDALGCTAIKTGTAFQATCPAGTDIRQMQLTFGSESRTVGDEFAINGLGCPEPNCPTCEEAAEGPLCDQRGTVWNNECEMNRITCLFPADPLVPAPCPTDAPTAAPAPDATFAPTPAETLAPTEVSGDEGGIADVNRVSASGGIMGSDLTVGGLAGVLVAAVVLIGMVAAFAWKRKQRRSAPPPQELEDDDGEFQPV